MAGFVEDTETTDRPRHGGMDCKAKTAYTIKNLVKGHSIWRGAGCGPGSRLIPGTDLHTRETAATPA